MAVLTAYNVDVQKYVAEPNKKYKTMRLETILNNVYESAAVSVSKLFTPAIKRVIDEIVYQSSGAGICKIGADTLAERCGFSENLVYKAVSALKKTGEYTVARLADGHAGKYIFVDNAHENFELIMRDVFYLSMNEIETTNNSQEKGHRQGHRQGLENGEEPTAPSDSEEKNAPIYSSSFISSLKQVNNNYNNAHAYEAINELENEELTAIKDEIETGSNANNTREYVEQYATNDFQVKFYDRIMLFAGIYPSQVIDNAALLSLRLGSNCSKERYTRAKELIHSIAMQIVEGTEYFENVVATFTGALNKAENYRNVPKAPEKYATGDRTKEQNLAKESINHFARFLGMQPERAQQQKLARSFVSILGL